jgi:hypothetical protein
MPFLAARIASVDLSGIATDSGRTATNLSSLVGGGSCAVENRNFYRALFDRFGYSPPASGALKKDKRWLKVIIATTPYI